MATDYGMQDRGSTRIRLDPDPGETVRDDQLALDPGRPQPSPPLLHRSRPSPRDPVGGGVGRGAASALLDEFARWWRTPRQARAYFLVVVSAAAAVIVWTVARDAAWRDAAPLAALTAVGMIVVELGRMAEGGRVSTDRTHKGLSVFPFAAALVTLPGLAGVVVIPVYIHARYRGLKIALWKWVISAATVTLSAWIGGTVFRSLLGPGHGATGSARSLGALAAGAAAFLAVESLLFFGISRLNDPPDEVLLRARLASVDFYATESGMLASGAIAAVLCQYWIGYLALLVPLSAIQQRAVLYQPLKFEARHDPKTRLLNDKAWREAANAMFGRARRQGRSLAVVFLDLDRFKAINDTFGHLAGDQVLVGVANTLSDLIRDADIAGRYGGEEFCVLLPDCDSRRAMEVAERLREAIAHLRFSPRELRVTASLGVATLGPTARPNSINELLDRADQALYQAKQDGRDCTREWQP
jgi:diguanylate cyclase (GGDEF)-like protein